MVQKLRKKMSKYHLISYFWANLGKWPQSAWYDLDIIHVCVREVVRGSETANKGFKWFLDDPWRIN